MNDQRILHENEPRAVEREPRPQARGGSVRAPAPTSGERLTRRRRTANPFDIDPATIPPGWSYEWKRQSVHGQPDNEHWIDMRENHWRPVPADRHPQLASQGDSIIKRGGTVLCERPKYLTDEARMEDIQMGLDPVQQMEEVMFGTKQGELTRDHPSVRKASYVRRQFAPGEPVVEGGGTDGLSAEP